MKANRKVFYRHISRKRKTRANLCLLLNEGGDPVIKDMEHAKILNAFFVLVFIAKTSFLQSQLPETSGKVRSKQDHRWRIKFGNI